MGTLLDISGSSLVNIGYAPPEAPSIEASHILHTLATGDLSRWNRPFSPGSPGAAVCERTRLHAAYTMLFAKVVSEVGYAVGRPTQSECPFSNGMDEWSALRHSNGTHTLLEDANMKPHAPVVGEAPPFETCAKELDIPKATAPSTQDETSAIERVKQVYSYYHKEILTSLSTSPLTYFSNSCGNAFAVPHVATCLTAATLAATSYELSQMSDPSFNIFTSIARFRNTHCAQSVPCYQWRTGHWGVQLKSRPTNVKLSQRDAIVTAPTLFESIFTATVGPSNINSKGDIRRLRERRATLFPMSSVTNSLPRYRALEINGVQFEYSTSRGVFTARTTGAARGRGDNVQTLDLPPNVFFRQVLKASRSIVLDPESGGAVRQRFPSLVMIDGDSLYRGLIFVIIQRLREHSLGSDTTHPLGANVYDVLGPVPSTGGHGESIYFMFPTPTGIVDVLVERPHSYGYDVTVDVQQYRQQRRSCAEAIRVLAAEDDAAVYQELILKFLSSSMIALPNGTLGNWSVADVISNSTYAPRAFTGLAEFGTDVIQYAHIICGSPTKGSSLAPSFNCPIVILYHTFNNLQQESRTATWSSSTYDARVKMSKEEKAPVLDKTLSLAEIVNVGMRVHGAGAWLNEFKPSVLNAAALSSDDSAEPPLNINRLATTQHRNNFREACALAQMRKGVCSSQRTTSPGSDITGVCSFVSPMQYGRHTRMSWDGYSEEYSRYPQRLGREDPGMLPSRNTRFEAYARALTAIWEASLDANANTTIFSDWCQSAAYESPRLRSPAMEVNNSNTTIGAMESNNTTADKIFMMKRREDHEDAANQLEILCNNSQELVDIVRSSALKTNTVFYDAALLRSLSPITIGDNVHYDCGIRNVHSDLNVPADTPQVIVPGMFSFPNTTNVLSLSEPMCGGGSPSMDAAGLAHLLASSFKSHFTTDANVSTMYDVLPSAIQGSMTVSVTHSYADDHCRCTFQRSEAALLFGLA